MSDAEVLTHIESIIEANRDARAPGHQDADRLAALKQIAKEIRARTADTDGRSPLLDALSFHVDAANRSKSRIGYHDVGNLQAVAECVLGNWPAIRAALKTSGRMT